MTQNYLALLLSVSRRSECCMIPRLWRVTYGPWHLVS